MKGFTILLCLTLVLAVALARPEKSHEKDSQTRDALDDFEKWKNKQDKSNTQQGGQQQQRTKRSQITQQRQSQVDTALVDDNLSQQTTHGKNQHDDLRQQTQQRHSGSYLDDGTLGSSIVAANDNHAKRQNISDNRAGALVNEERIESAVIPDAESSGGDHHHVTKAPTVWQKIQKGAEDAYKATVDAAGGAYKATVDAAQQAGEAIKETVG